MWTKAFWREAAERAIKTVAQTEIALLTADAIAPVDALHIDWAAAAGVGAGAALLSVLTSLASWAAPVGEDDSPSLVHLDGPARHRRAA